MFGKLLFSGIARLVDQHETESDSDLLRNGFAFAYNDIAPINMM
jgi:hypothetical protein